MLRALDMVKATGRKRIGVVGLSFEEGTEDLRLSPLVQLVELLIGKGYAVKVYGPYVRLARILGTNRRYIRKEIPHIGSLLSRWVAELIRFAEVIVLGQQNPTWQECARRVRADQTVIDLVHVSDRNVFNGSYRGICW
jgi:GDP-mannose 6-dehydrogenase